MSEDALAHQANDAAQQNAGGDRNGRSANAGPMLLGSGLQRWILAALGSELSAFSRHSWQEE